MLAGFPEAEDDRENFSNILSYRKDAFSEANAEVGDDAVPGAAPHSSVEQEDHGSASSRSRVQPREEQHMRCNTQAQVSTCETSVFTEQPACLTGQACASTAGVADEISSSGQVICSSRCPDDDQQVEQASCSPACQASSGNLETVPSVHQPVDCRAEVGELKMACEPSAPSSPESGHHKECQNFHEAAMQDHEGSAPNPVQVKARADAMNTMRGAFFEECNRGLSPNSAAVQVIRRCVAPPPDLERVESTEHVEAKDHANKTESGETWERFDTPRRTEVKEAFRGAFLEQRSLGYSPNSAFIEVLHRCSLSGKDGNNEGSTETAPTVATRSCHLPSSGGGVSQQLLLSEAVKSPQLHA